MTALGTGLGRWHRSSDFSPPQQPSFSTQQMMFDGSGVSVWNWGGLREPLDPGCASLQWEKPGEQTLGSLALRPDPPTPQTHHTDGSQIPQHRG